MNLQCPFDKPGARQVANFPCKFQEHPTRPHIHYCTVCGQGRHINRVGQLIPTWMLFLMVFVTIWLILKVDSQKKDHKPQHKTQNTTALSKFIVP